MAQVATYTVEAFVEDVRNMFASTTDPRAQAQFVARHMQELLKTPGWLEERINLPAEGGFGRYDLHQDDEFGHPEDGFLLMCGVQPAGQEGVPHDHGTTWVVYGVYEGAIEQTKWRWFYKGEGVDSPRIKETGRFVQKNGKVAFFLPGEIHHTRNITGGRALVVRLESQKLTELTRYQYDPNANTVKKMDR